MVPKKEKDRPDPDSDTEDTEDFDGYHELDDDYLYQPNNTNDERELTASQAAAVMALSDIFEEGEPEDEYYDYYKPDRIREITQGDIDTVSAHARDCMELMRTRQMENTELKSRLFIYEDLLVMLASETAVRVEIICLKAGILTPREMRDLVRRKAKKQKEKS